MIPGAGRRAAGVTAGPSRSYDVRFQSRRLDTRVSIVIPAYDEQSRLPRTVLATLGWCSSQQLDFELIIADGGSKDSTLSD